MLAASHSIIPRREVFTISGTTTTGLQVNHLPLTRAEAGKLAYELLIGLGIKLDTEAFTLLQATFDRSQREG